RAEPRGRVAGDVVSEVHERADERPEVQRDVEGLVQARIGEDRPVEEPRHDDQVTRARDRRELGHALGDAEHDRLQDGRGGSSAAAVENAAHPSRPRFRPYDQRASRGAIVTVMSPNAVARASCSAVSGLTSRTRDGPVAPPAWKVSPSCSTIVRISSPLPTGPVYGG